MPTTATQEAKKHSLVPRTLGATPCKTNMSELAVALSARWQSCIVAELFAFTYINSFVYLFVAHTMVMYYERRRRYKRLLPYI